MSRMQGLKKFVANRGHNETGSRIMEEMDRGSNPLLMKNVKDCLSYRVWRNVTR